MVKETIDKILIKKLGLATLSSEPGHRRFVCLSTWTVILLHYKVREDEMVNIGDAMYM